jgi:hypothetical protein
MITRFVLLALLLTACSGKYYWESPGHGLAEFPQDCDGRAGAVCW